MASKNLEVSLLLDCYGNTLTQKQKNLLDYYYNDDLSLSEIAENEGITRQGVRDTIKRATQQLENLENSIGFLEYQQNAEYRFEKIRLLCNACENEDLKSEIISLTFDE